VLPVATLKPGDEGADELGESDAFLVDDAVLLLVGEIEGADALPNRTVEELEPGADEPLHRAAVEAGEARELAVVREIEPPHDEREHLRVLGTDPVVGSRWQTELAAETPQELRRALERGGEPLVGFRPRHRLGQEEPEGKRELAVGNASGDVLERDPCLLEGGHEANEVNVGRRVEPVLVARLEDAEILQPADLLERARDELGQLSRRDLGHGVTLASCYSATR
jgi:hypothetical protein